ncbi:MAG: hypothetical protein AAF449_23525, partial [Myxococcota bacterium]
VKTTPLYASKHSGALVVDRLPIGREVRVLAKDDEWTVVLVGSDGPVGFVSTSAIGQWRPMAALVEERRFSGCSVEGDTGQCLRRAASSQADCEQRCGGSKLEPTRCKFACQIAFDQCAVDCRGTQVSR